MNLRIKCEKWGEKKKSCEDEFLTYLTYKFWREVPEFFSLMNEVRSSTKSKRGQWFALNKVLIFNIPDLHSHTSFHIWIYKEVTVHQKCELSSVLVHLAKKWTEFSSKFTLLKVNIVQFTNLKMNFSAHFSVHFKNLSKGSMPKHNLEVFLSGNILKIIFIYKKCNGTSIFFIKNMPRNLGLMIEKWTELFCSFSFKFTQ